MQQRTVMMWCLVVSSALPLAARVAVAQPVFRAASTFPLTGTISDATSLFAVVDVGSQNGPPDGILDVVAAEQAQPGVAAVLFGNGDGTFGAGPNTSLGRIPTALAVADVNGDTFPDLLVGDFSNTIAVFAGNPDGPPFQPLGDPIDAGISPVAIAMADVNGDQKLDALVVDEGTQRGGVTVLLGQGDGTFTQSVCSGGTNANHVCSLPAACPGGSCVSIVGEVFTAGVGSAAIAVGDFNGDGKLDVAVANKVSNDVTVMRGAGSGFFTTTQTVSVGEEPVAIAARDLNGDGRVDLVVTNRNSDNIAVLNGAGDGTFANARFFPSGSAGSTPTGLALGDVNHDGAFDVLVPNNRSSDASVLLGDGHGNFAAPRAFVADQEPLAIAAADVDGDGVTDVVTVNRGSQAPDAAVLLSRGDGGLSAVEDVVTQPSPTGVTAGDIDNDGIPDLIVAHSPAAAGGGIILAYRAQPPLGFAEPLSVQAAGDAVALGRGDFNGDGRLDIVVANKSTSNVSVFLGQLGGGFGAAQNYPVGNGASALAVGDWNRDGRDDLAVARQGSRSGAVDVLLANPAGGFGSPVSTAVGQGTCSVTTSKVCLSDGDCVSGETCVANPTALDVGDFNEDGKRDLAVIDNISGDVSVLAGNADGTFHVLRLIQNLRGPKAVVVADFDRDRHDDIAVALAMDRNVAIYYGNGQGNFTLGPSSLSVDGSPSALAARDISGDGIPDLLVSDEVSNAVAMFRSLGASRRFAQDEAPTVSRRPISLVTADFDNDGRYDGAAADNFVAGSVSVLTNVVAPPVLRGDGNADGRVSAADAVAVMRELGDGNGTRIEDVTRPGNFAAAPGVDANGDGVVTSQDALAVAHRLFAGS